MTFRPLEDIIGPITLPIRGKNYTLPTVSLEDGVRMHQAAAGGSELPLADLIIIILGDVREVMISDGVPLGDIDRALWTGVADFQSGRAAAEAVWEHGVPKEILANLLKPVQEAAAALTTPQDGEPTTKLPASGNGTTKATCPKGSPSRGPKSSTKRTGRS